jgi:1,4-dihydroxy-2-naphthoate octaprenyltransferase
MHERDAHREAAPLDPQKLTFGQTLVALLSLGRIPLASEVPLWCFFGCLLSSQVFPISSNNPIDSSTTKISPNVSPFHHFDLRVTLQCMLVVWGTNISINYGNEYFDYDMDRPGMVAAIKRDLKARRDLLAKKKGSGEILKSNGEGVRGQEMNEMDEMDVPLVQENDKIMGSTTRIIHDGTFPPYTALLCSVFVQLLLLLLVTASRHSDNYGSRYPISTSSSPAVTPISPFRGVALYIGLLCTFLSQMYVGPPLRLHYNGYGELVSALLLCPVSVLFGLVGHYTAVSGRPLTLSEFVGSIQIPFARPYLSTQTSSGFALDAQLLTPLVAFYLYEQARILIMHIHDIDADRQGGKITMTVRLGFTRATRLYVVLNALSVILFTIIGLQFGRVAVFGTSFGPGGGHGYGSLYRIAGIDSDETAARIQATAWLAGLLTVMAYAIPCMVMTARSLFAKNSATSRDSRETKVANKVIEEITSSSGVQDRDADAMRGRQMKTARKGTESTRSNTNKSSHGNGHPASNNRKSLPSSTISIINLVGSIPVWPHAELVKIVSLQMLLTPVVFSVSLALGLVAATGTMA